MKFIEKLQQKPKATKVLIMWLATAFVMIAVIIIWLVTFSNKMVKQEEEVNNDSEIPSLFQNLEKDFDLLKQELKAGVNKFNQEVDISE